MNIPSVIPQIFNLQFAIFNSGLSGSADYHKFARIATSARIGILTDGH